MRKDLHKSTSRDGDSVVDILGGPKFKSVDDLCSIL